MDFTIKKHKELLLRLKEAGYEFQTFYEFLKMPKNKVVLLRHDVDLLPENSLRFAEIQHELDLKGTYYFRMVPESWNEEIIAKIASLGHEVGYHYETMDTSFSKLKKQKKNFDYNDLTKVAYEEFKSNLEEMRKLVDVNTICMHGSPRSPYDNKDIWKDHDYKDLGLLGEPYFDVDFNKVFYLTDTGRRWDGHKVSVRDKVETELDGSYHATEDIIEAIRNLKLPDQIMFTFHPQRWHDNKNLWMKEFIFQNLKNIVKKYVYVKH